MSRAPQHPVRPCVGRVLCFLIDVCCQSWYGHEAVEYPEGTDRFLIVSFRCNTRPEQSGRVLCFSGRSRVLQLDVDLDSVFHVWTVMSVLGDA